jgi:predicted ribosomally synthesized peptide with SipW-like signal peptide
MKGIRDTFEPLIVSPYTPPLFRVRMMDINRPIIVATGPVESERAPSAKREVRPPLRTNAHWVMAAGSSLMIMALITGLSTIGGTVSYFSDSERSEGNTLGAGVLDFTVAVTSETTSFTFQDGVLQDSDGVLTMNIERAPGSMDILYDLTLSYVSGNLALCEAIEVLSEDPILYDGPIFGLTRYPVPFAGEWTLLISLGGSGGYALGDTCSLNFEFGGWHAPYETSPGWYEDGETVTLTFTALGTLAPVAPTILELQSTTLPVETEEEKENNNEPNHGEPVREEGKGSEKAQEVLNELHEETETASVKTETPPTNDVPVIEEEVVEETVEETTEVLEVVEPETSPESEPDSAHAPEKSNEVLA